MKNKTELLAEVKQFASSEGLRYVSDNKPGFTRKKSGKKFKYFDQTGSLVKDPEVIKRINSIGIPPAYQNVWICPYDNGHLQATGIDARGRKQYRYHTKWRQVRDQDKFQHMLLFGENLSKIRRRIEHDMKLPGLSHDKVLAAVVKLLEITLIRVGNSEYARDNNSYGLTTMRKKHIRLSGDEIKFEFMGKSGKKWSLSLHDKRIAAITKRCAEIPGHELYKYIDDKGVKRDVTSADVNHYLQSITGENFTAKDFRTWAGTVMAALALNEFQKFDSTAEAKKNIVSAILKVSGQLGNTPAICRKCYVHPEILNAYLSGQLVDMLEAKIEGKIKKDFNHLKEEEIMVLAFLKKRLKGTK